MSGLLLLLLLLILCPLPRRSLHGCGSEFVWLDLRAFLFLGIGCFLFRGMAACWGKFVYRLFFRLSLALAGREGYDVDVG